MVSQSAGFVPYFLSVEGLNESSCQSVFGGLVMASHPSAQRWGGRMVDLDSLWKSQLFPERNPSFVAIFPATGGRAGRADSCVLLLDLELGISKTLEFPDLVLYP